MSAPRITTRPHRIRTVGGLRKAAREVGSLWFSRESCEWFGTRFPDSTITYPPFASGRERGYFITSEQDTSTTPDRAAWEGQRRYTVRVFEITRAEGDPATPDRIEVESASEFMEYATLDEARAALAFIAGVTR